jgi:uncharacterized repeat protein (TIGR01451 family)
MNNRTSAVNVQGIKTINPATFTTTASNISSRTLTTASVAWVPGAIIEDQKFSTSNISSVITELIGQVGYASGQALGFVLSGPSGTNGADQTNSWAFDHSGNPNEEPRLVIVYSSCATPTFTATATQATCTGTSANNNGTLALSSFAYANKVGYSAGGAYSGTPAFAGATTVTGSTFTITNTLTNPSAPQPYTIRVFCDATTFKDTTVVLPPRICVTSNLSLAVSPTTITASQGEIVNFTFTLTNAGPNPADNVTTYLPIPTNVTLLNALPAQGTFDTGTKMWSVGTVPVGTKTIVLALKVN